MRNPTLLFLDCETLGLGDAPVWEIAAIRVDELGDVEAEFHCFVEHGDPDKWLKTLPEPFAEDYKRRWDKSAAWPQHDAIAMLQNIAHRTIACGSNVGFDMTRLEAMADKNNLQAPGWHYHPEDIPTLARGWLNGRGVYPAPPWKSDLISQMCGVDPTEFDRHTAMGDCQWMFELWKAVQRK